MTDPFGGLAPANMEYAKVSQHPLSFQIFFQSTLPKHIHIDHDLMEGALKNGAVYRVVVVPYVQVSLAYEELGFIKFTFNILNSI